MDDFIYIAGPFFKPNEVITISMIEEALSKENLEYFSPRSEGTLIEMTPAEKLEHRKKIFQSNIDHIRKAMCVVAVIDDRDIGTIWEMGYAFGIGVPVISFSNKDYGLNVMLAESVQAHTRSIYDMLEAVLDPNYKGELVEQIY